MTLFEVWFSSSGVFTDVVADGEDKRMVEGCKAFLGDERHESM